MIPTWVILAVPAVILAGHTAICWYLRRRDDRAQAARIASKVHDRKYLDWLEDEFAKTNGGRT